MPRILGSGFLPQGTRGGTVAWYRAGGAPAPLEAWDAEDGASYAAAKIGLANGLVLAEVGGAPSWAAGTGWSNFPTLPGRALNTGITPLNNQSYSLILKFAGAVGGNTWLLASYNGALVYFGIRPLLTTNATYGNGGLVTVAGGGAASGIMAVAGNQAYLNGAPAGGAIPTAVGAFTVPVYIGCSNNNGTPNLYFPGAIAKVAIWASNIAAYVPAITAAM